METSIHKYVQGIKVRDLDMTIHAIADLDVEATVAHWIGGGALAYLVVSERMAEAGSFDEVFLEKVVNALTEKGARLHSLSKPFGGLGSWFLLAFSTVQMSMILLSAGADPRFEVDGYLSAYTTSQDEDDGKFELFQRHIAEQEASELKKTTFGLAPKQPKATDRKSL